MGLNYTQNKTKFITHKIFAFSNVQNFMHSKIFVYTVVSILVDMFSIGIISAPLFYAVYTFYWQAHVTESVIHILDALFECTLDMINKDLEEFPEHRINFFKMLQSINKYCFPGQFCLYVCML